MLLLWFDGLTEKVLVEQVLEELQETSEAAFSQLAGEKTLLIQQ